MNRASAKPAESKPVSPTTVAAAIEGDRSAMREIYDATSVRVYALMVRMVGRQEADDLTQQVYVRAFAKLNQFAAQAKFETWLYRLATNEALQYLRYEKRRRMSPLEIEPACSPEQDADKAERIDRLHAALAELDPQLRQIVSLREDAGLSYAEIAAVVGIPEGTVGSRLNRARKELATSLGCGNLEAERR